MDLIKINKLIRSCLKVAPVDVVRIANEFGIEVCYDQLGQEVSGYIEKSNDNGYKIVVNSDHSRTRKRFTIAHELGHWWHHRDLIDNYSRLVEHFENDRLYRDRLYRQNFATSDEELLNDRYEKEANCFAANFLMPAELIHTLISDEEIFEIEALADKLAVPTETLGYRLDALGIDLKKVVVEKVSYNCRITKPTRRSWFS